MKSLRRDLFERRLWPLAVVIVAAIVAVPFLLHGHRANAEIAAPPVPSGTPTTSSSTTSSSASHNGHASSRRPTTPTSRSRDPFEAASVTTTTSTSSTSTTVAPSTTTAGTSDSPPSSSSSSAGPAITSPSTGAASSSSASETTTPVTTTPATTTSPATTPATTSSGTTSHYASKKTSSWEIYSVDLRVGAPGSPVAHHNIARLTPLPRERSPQAMYMGVDDHGRSAVFALGAGVEVRAVGGSHSTGAFCHPSRVDCALAVVPAGKSVALLYVSSTGSDRALLLRVTRIKSRVTRSESVVRAARRHVSPIGLCDLKLGDPIGFFDLSEDSVSVPSTGACRRRKLAVAFPGSLGAGSSVRG
jgi:hypothetical protein